MAVLTMAILGCETGVWEIQRRDVERPGHRGQGGLKGLGGIWLWLAGLQARNSHQWHSGTRLALEAPAVLQGAETESTGATTR